MSASARNISKTQLAAPAPLFPKLHSLLPGLPPYPSLDRGCLSSVKRRGDALVRSWNRNRNRSWSWNSKTYDARDLVTFLWGGTRRAATELQAESKHAS